MWDYSERSRVGSLDQGMNTPSVHAGFGDGGDGGQPKVVGIEKQVASSATAVGRLRLV